MRHPGRRTPYGNVTAFVLAQPADLRPREVVARGATAGLAMTEDGVRSIRSRYRRKAHRPKSSPKTDFILARVDLRRADILAAAAAAGVSMSANLVSKIRGADRAVRIAFCYAALEIGLLRAGELLKALAESGEDARSGPVRRRGWGDKASFVASQPLRVPAREVVVRGRLAGVELTAHYVRKVRRRLARRASVAR